MSSTPVSANKAEAQRIHQMALQYAERVDRSVCGLLTDLAHANNIVLPKPVHCVIHDESHIANRCHAVWSMLLDRGRFIAKVELYDDPAPASFHLRAMLQSNIWDKEAQQFGERLCEFTKLPVQVERSQTDGIVTYSASLSPA